MTATSRAEKLSAAFFAAADTLTGDYDVVSLMYALLSDCTEILDLQAGGIMLADGSGDLQLMASTTEKADFVEHMLLNASRGPCLDCYSTGEVVSVSDIQAFGARWPDFRTGSERLGFLAVHAIPMRLRGRVVGTMNLFGTSSGALSTDDMAVAKALADVATIGLLQERGIRETGIVADQLQRALSTRVLIEQATGVLAASGAGSLENAFLLIREHARVTDVPVRVVAEKIVARKLLISGSSLVDHRRQSH